jgi:uncharacterized protein YkwD/chitodextrinase
VHKNRPNGALRLACKTLALAGVAAAAIAFAPAHQSTATAAGVGDCNPNASWPANRQDYADQVVALVNQHRASLGLTQLKVSPTLTAAAVWKARHMAAYGYMAHDDPAPPVARTWFQRVQACGYAGNGAGENIAYGYTTPAAVMNGWLNSPGHKANIENASYRVIGVGVAGSTIYWSQDFGTTDDSGSGTPPPPPPPPPPADTTAPSAPGTLTATSPSASQITLTWGGATDNVAVTGYRVYRGGVQVGTTTSTTYTDSGLAASTPYSYTVRAYDAASNLGPSSNTATATTQSASTPPPPPPPPSSGGTTVYAGSYALQAGASAGGLVSNLRAQDGSTLDVATSPYRGAPAWYARFSVPRSFSSLTVSYAGSATQPCTRSISVYDWSSFTWQVLSTGTAGTATSTLTLRLAAPFARYLGGSGTNGEVRIRVACSRTDATPFTLRTDRLTLGYS